MVEALIRLDQKLPWLYNDLSRVPSRVRAIPFGSSATATVAELVHDVPTAYGTLSDDNAQVPALVERLQATDLDDQESVDVLLRGFLGQARDGEWSFRVLGGQAFSLTGLPALPPGEAVSESAQYWLAGSLALTESFRGRTVELTDWVCERVGSRADIVPLYDDENCSMGRAFIRSRSLYDLLPLVERPAACENDDQWSWFVACAQLVHHPHSFEQISEATDEDRPSLLRATVERFAPDAWQPYDPEAAYAQFIADLGPGALEHVAEHIAEMKALDDEIAAQTADNQAGRPLMPDPRLVKTARDAELRAAEVMTALGFTAVAVTPVGPDAGVDVNALEAVAQVKMEGVPTGRPALQRLAGAAWGHGKVGLFFSLAGYSAQALQWAELSDIACFEFAYDGSIIACTGLAQALLDRGIEALPAE